MKNKTVIILLSVLAVAMWTAAVINFCLGNVLSGIGDVLMASSDALMAYTLYRVGQLGRMADTTRKAVIGLLELLAKAESMEDILKIENRLTKIREELETVKSKLRVYDNLVNYGTVYLNIREVVEYTVVDEPETVWERIGTGFMHSLKDLGEFFTELFVFLVVGLPYFVLIGIVLTAVLLLLKRRKKKKAQK